MARGGSGRPAEDRGVRGAETGVSDPAAGEASEEAGGAETGVCDPEGNPASDPRAGVHAAASWARHGRIGGHAWGVSPGEGRVGVLVGVGTETPAGPAGAQVDG